MKTLLLFLKMKLEILKIKAQLKRDCIYKRMAISLTCDTFALSTEIYDPKKYSDAYFQFLLASKDGADYEIRVFALEKAITLDPLKLPESIIETATGIHEYLNEVS